MQNTKNITNQLPEKKNTIGSNFTPEKNTSSAHLFVFMHFFLVARVKKFVEIFDLESTYNLIQKTVKI